MKISYSFGVVDFLHFGHLEALRVAKDDADLHVFGLLNDEAANSWMGVVVSSYEERKAVLNALEYVDQVMQQDSVDPTQNLKKLHQKYPDAEISLFHRGDWKALPADTYIRSIGGKVVPTKYYERLAPENILKMLQAEENNRTDMPFSNLISTKANTLLALQPLVRKSEIEPIMIVLGKEFYGAETVAAKKVAEKFSGKRIVVRSSSSNEDCYEQSNAGHYKSILNVDSTRSVEVENAVREVFASYGAAYSDLQKEQVLIQTHTPCVQISGVVFTRDIKQNRPYYVINYDDTGSTDSVTSGAGGKTIFVSRDIALGDLDQPWGQLLDAVHELEEILNGITLDIEFAITTEGKIVIFQVRPLAANYRFKRIAKDETYYQLKNRAKHEYANLQNKAGSSSMKLSDMAFWNPAEMIGSNPKCLDYSLYRQIITKFAWNEGLVPMGYRRVQEELMYKIGNKPYISLDYSFQALTPASVPEPLLDKLLEYYRAQLEKNPTAHDKIEFEIVFNCYDFATEHHIRNLLNAGFTDEEVQKLQTALYTLTDRCVKEYFATLQKDKGALERLEEVRSYIAGKRSFIKGDYKTLIDGFKDLVAAISQFGTPQFARQARYAFMANMFCRSLVEMGYWTEQDQETFLGSIVTVAKELERDMEAFSRGMMTRLEFDRRYGHLRSGSYDISQERYEKLEFAQGKNREQEAIQCTTETRLSAAAVQGVDRALKKIGFSVSAEDFLAFLKSALEEREKFKFEFTKSLSDALELLVYLGECLAIPRSEMAYLEIQDILASEYYETQENVRKFFNTIIEQRKAEYDQNSALVLPDIIWDAKDLDMVKIGEARPNFITGKCIEGPVCLIDSSTRPESIREKIVVIEKADPGYDWIFSQNIKGLITKYGGVASHMAIRCAEFNLPAAIGCGEKIYDFAAGAQRILLDCANGKIVDKG